MWTVILIISLLKVIDAANGLDAFHQKYKLLNDGNVIPALAFGTWANTSDLHKVIPSVIYAIEVGYRNLDTAHLYGNEHLIGEALSIVFERGLVRREDIFITTKLDVSVPSREMVIPSLQKNLWRLKLDYVDLFLIHTPYNTFNYPNYDILDIWRGMEDAKKLGLTKSIGISNFNSTHVNRILKYGKIRPAVNEIEVNPTRTQLDLVAYTQSQGITVMSYAPFGYLVPRMSNEFVPPTFGDPTLVKIARKYGKDTSQVVLRYLMDRDTIPIPRSHNPLHISTNADLFDFSITQEEVYAINEFNKNLPAYGSGEGFTRLIRQAYNALLQTMALLYK
ncbi:aldo-keto reductase AKR2E4-like [Bicyclus anynana]|uniref:Aldo-keto reductase AKR2E4-like n=1 Tax=Bicyclus anynana TaxID=110368 RepID=A0ABM3LJ04_BICAN|nr:aldo-keto reductase AKR2E4-like [Bicyclus anynana]